MIADPFRAQAHIDAIVATVYRLLADLEDNTTMPEPRKSDVRKKLWQYAIDMRTGRIIPTPLSFPTL